MQNIPQAEQELFERLERLLEGDLDKHAEDAQLIDGLSSFLSFDQAEEVEEEAVTKEATPAEAVVEEKKPLKKVASVTDFPLRTFFENEHARQGFLDTLNRRAIEIEMALEKCAEAYVLAYLEAKEKEEQDKK